MDHANARPGALRVGRACHCRGDARCAGSARTAAPGAGGRCRVEHSPGDRSGRGRPARRGAGLAARRRSRHVSIRDLEQYDVGRRRGRRGHRADGASTPCWASSRRTRRGWATGRSRRSSTRRWGQRMRELGHEYGAVTGRPRRCGWFDAVVVAVRGADQWAEWAGRDEARCARHAGPRRDLHAATSSPATCTPSSRAISRRWRMPCRATSGSTGWRQSTADDAARSRTCQRTRAGIWIGSSRSSRRRSVRERRLRAATRSSKSAGAAHVVTCMARPRSGCAGQEHGTGRCAEHDVGRGHRGGAVRSRRGDRAQARRDRGRVVYDRSCLASSDRELSHVHDASSRRRRRSRSAACRS